MSEHQAKTHPAAGFIFALIIAAILIALMGAFNGMGHALFLVPFLGGWAILSLVLFGRVPSDDEAPSAHH